MAGIVLLPREIIRFEKRDKRSISHCRIEVFQDRAVLLDWDAEISFESGDFREMAIQYAERLGYTRVATDPPPPG